MTPDAWLFVSPRFKGLVFNSVTMIAGRGLARLGSSSNNAQSPISLNEGIWIKLYRASYYDLSYIP